MKRFYLLGLLLFVMVVLFSCGQTTDMLVQQKQSQDLAEGQREVGIPQITNFQEMRLLKQIYELRDQSNLVTYSYLQSSLTGKLIYIGETVGFGIPYSVQYSSPQKVTYEGAGRGWTKMPQAEPNGLFPTGSTQATWLLLRDPKTGKASVAYFEPDIVVLQFKLPADSPLLQK